jgi:serpin B
MKYHLSFRESKVLILVGILGLILGGCSKVYPENGNGGEVLISEVSRGEIDNIPLEDIYLLAEGNTRFALDLYQQIRTEPGNLFYSPYSISSALAMTYAGAEGITAQEMADVFHFDLGSLRLHPAFNGLDQQLSALAEIEIQDEIGEPFQLNIANAIWGQKDYHFEEKFLDILAQNYGAGLRLLDYIKQPEESRQIINRWVSDQTEERIQDLIPQGAIDSDTRLVLSNAIYFIATWLEPFEESLTEEGTFYGLEGEELSAQMMKHATDPSFGYYQGDGFKAVDLPYIGGQISMLVIVPDRGAFSEFEKNLSYDQIIQTMAGLEYSPIMLRFPKFEYESEISLAQTLAEMGMPTAFSGAADFSGMTGSKDLFISDVFHKAFVSVDEEGTEAAAATAVIMKMVSAPLNPVELTVDRPFIFLIREHETNSILFMGRVVEP